MPIGGVALAKMAVKKFLGGGEDGEGVLGGVFNLIENKQDRKKFAQEVEFNIMEMLVDHGNKIADGQMEINKIEAAHPSFFVSGWRPFIAWICGAGLLYNFLIYHFIAWAWAFWQVQGEAPPNLDTAQLYPLLMGMLGLGGMRTLEKFQGVARKR